MRLSTRIMLVGVQVTLILVFLYTITDIFSIHPVLFLAAVIFLLMLILITLYHAIANPINNLHQIMLAVDRTDIRYDKSNIQEINEIYHLYEQCKKELINQNIEHQTTEVKLNKIYSAISAMAGVDLSTSAEIADDNSALDGIWIVLSMLRETLEASVNNKLDLETIIQSLGEAFIVTDVSGHITLTNVSLQKRLSYQADELIGMHISKLFAKTHGNIFHDSGLSKIIADGYLSNFESTLLSRSGQRISVLLSGSTLYNSNAEIKGMLCVATDISARKENEDKLTRSLETSKTISEILWISMMNIPLKGQLQLVLEKILTINNFSHKPRGSIYSINEQGQYLLCASINISREIKKQCSEIQSGTCLCGLAIAQKKICFDAHTVSSPVITPECAGDHVHYCVPIMSEEVVIGLLNISLPPSCHYDIEDEKVLKVIGNTIAGIIQRKNSEDKLIVAYDQLKKAQVQLLQSEKLAAIGEIAAGVAHEINNPLSFINSNLSTLKKYLDSMLSYILSLEQLKSHVAADSLTEANKTVTAINLQRDETNMDFIINDLGNLLAESQDGINRIRNIVLDLKTFSRADSSITKPVDVNVVINKVLNIIWNEIKYKIELQKNLESIPQILANEQQLGQVFINILVNASQAISEHGKISIHTYQSGDDWLMIDIEDSGTGIPPDILKQIFNPFFTTKQEGKGTGLGLSISNEIITRHGGQIKVDSTVGIGTKFSISLPIKSSSNPPS